MFSLRPAPQLYIRSKGHCECDKKLSAEKTNLIAVRLNLLNIVWLYSLLHVAILRTPSQTGAASRIGGARDLSPQGQRHVLLWTHQTTLASHQHHRHYTARDLSPQGQLHVLLWTHQTTLASHQHHRHYTAEGLTSCVEFPAMTVTPKTSSGRQSCSCRSSPWQISSSRLNPQRTGRPCQAGSAWQDFHHLRTHWGDHLDSSTPAEAFYRCQQRFAVSVWNTSPTFAFCGQRLHRHLLRGHAAWHLHRWPASRLSQTRHQEVYQKECKSDLRWCDEESSTLDEGRQLPWNHHWADSSSPSWRSAAASAADQLRSHAQTTQRPWSTIRQKAYKQ